MVLHGALSPIGTARRGPPEPVPGTPRRVVFGFLDLGEGGAQRLSLEACRHLRPDRFQGAILCVRGRGRLVEAARRSGLEVVALDRLRRPFDLGAVAVLSAELRRLHADVLHVALYSRASPYLRWAARWARVPLVVAHDWSQPEPQRRLRRLVDAPLRGATRFVAASEAQRRELVARGVSGDAVRVIHSGIDCRPFGLEGRAMARAALGLPQEVPVVLVPARLVAVKGHTTLLRALPALLPRFPALVTLLAGEGPLRQDLEGEARALGLDSSVRFLGTRDDMPRLLAAADLVVLPSLVEGLPAAILEAFAARRAVVASDVGGVAEALRDGTEGRLVPPRASEALAATMAELLDDPARRGAMGEQGRRTVEERFDVRRTTRTLEEAYEQWLAEAASRRGGSA